MYKCHNYLTSYDGEAVSLSSYTNLTLNIALNCTLPLILNQAQTNPNANSSPNPNPHPNSSPEPRVRILTPGLNGKRTEIPGIVANVLSTYGVLSWEDFLFAWLVNIVVVSVAGVAVFGWHNKSNVLIAEMLTAIIFFLGASPEPVGSLKDICLNVTAFSSLSLNGVSGYKSA